MFEDQILRPIEDLVNHQELQAEQEGEKYDNESSLKVKFEIYWPKIKSRKVDFVFYTEQTHIFILLDCSPSSLKYDVKTTKIHLEAIEQIVISLTKVEYIEFN